MHFFVLVDNLFIREGIRSILRAKYAESEIHISDSLDTVLESPIKENAYLICNSPGIFFGHLQQLKSRIHAGELKTILLANSVQLNEIKHKSIDEVHALIYTNCSLQDLNEALSYIQLGLKYRCKKLEQNVTSNTPFEQMLQKHQISGRETEIIKLVIEGKTSQEIADQLNISYNTVTTHRKNINKKLKLKNPNDLLRLSLGKTGE